MKQRLIFIFLLLILLFISPLAGMKHSAAQTQVKSDQLNDSTKTKILDWVCGTLNDYYVYPETAKKMEQFLRKQFKSGLYRNAGSVQEFTALLTRHLLSICKDKHLRVAYNPDPPPPDTSTDAEKEKRKKERIERERKENFYFREVKILNGNIGYLRFDHFSNSLHAGSTAVAAMNFLAHCDALIIDLRYNGGGNGDMIQLLLSYFFDEPVHYNNMYFRKRDVTEQNWTSAYVQGPKLTGVDLYVLTSSSTFSAAEEFTYDLKNLERAVIIGGTTGGGAHPVDYQYLREFGIELKIPVGRSYNPKTGLDWEGTGIEPHQKVEPETALATAHVLALEKLYEKAPDTMRDARKWTWEYQKALLQPVAVEVEILKKYAGRFGPVRIVFENNGLAIFEPGAAQSRTLVPLSQNLFVIDGVEAIRVRVETDATGEATLVEAVFNNGRTQRLPKTEQKK